MAESGTFLGEVERGWHRFWGLGWKIKGPVLGLLFLITVGALGSAGGSTASSSESSRASSTSKDATTQPSSPRGATETPTPKPTNTATPSPTPAPPTPTPTPIVYSGSGQKAVGPITLPTGLFVVRFTHSGRSNFIVKSYDSKGSNDLLVNVIGAYSGSNALTGPETFTFDIQADGAWTAAVTPIGYQLAASISDRGPAVSGVFPAPTGAKTFAISHDGKSNFIVNLSCDKGSRQLIQNQIGAVNGSRVVSFPSGASICFWEVKADGNWSLIQQ